MYIQSLKQRKKLEKFWIAYSFSAAMFERSISTAICCKSESGARISSHSYRDLKLFSLGTSLALRIGELGVILLVSARISSPSSPKGIHKGRLLFIPCCMVFDYGESCMENPESRTYEIWYLLDWIEIISYDKPENSSLILRRYLSNWELDK